jgi:itaconyl-CoA hydratase
MSAAALDRKLECGRLLSSLTHRDTYFEDFEVGEVRLGPRGRTIGETEHMAWTAIVMNTAQLHFNQAMCDQAPKTYFDGRRVVYGGIVFAFVAGLASEDTTENALAELSFNNGRHTHPVFAGDTLFAESQVTGKRDADQPDAGIVAFKLLGKNQHGKVVLEIDREVLIKRKSHWGPAR